MKRVLVIALTGICALIIILAAFAIFGNEENYFNEGGNNIENNEVLYTQDELDSINNDKLGSAGNLGSSGGGGSSGSSSGGSAGNAEECTLPVAHALKNFEQNEECLSFSEGACVHKTLNCSAEIHNLDETLGGDFVLDFRIYSNESEMSASKSTTLGPNSYLGIENVFDITTGYDNVFTCNIIITSVPQRECSSADNFVG